MPRAGRCRRGSSRACSSGRGSLRIAGADRPHAADAPGGGVGVRGRGRVRVRVRGRVWVRVRVRVRVRLSHLGPLLPAREQGV